jgi:hypothetical protein
MLGVGWGGALLRAGAAPQVGDGYFLRASILNTQRRNLAFPAMKMWLLGGKILVTRQRNSGYPATKFTLGAKKASLIGSSDDVFIF